MSMAGRVDYEEFEHVVHAWTVGQLRQAISNLPDQTPLLAVTAEEPGGTVAGCEQVVIDEGKAGRAPSSGEITFLERARVVVREAVDAHDLGALVEQPIGEGRADEAGRPGDECPHAKISLSVTGRRQGRPSRLTGTCTVRAVARTRRSSRRTSS